MLRRDISKVLLATATASGATAIVQRADAQSCTAPCYAQTAMEAAAGFTPVNQAYPPCDIRRAGAKCDGVTDDTSAVQAMANFCVTENVEMIVPGLTSISASIEINRQVDGASYDAWLSIRGTGGGGFYASSAIPMFSTSLTYTGSPVTQLVCFKDLIFQASSSSMLAYVLDSNKYLRTAFVNCTFDKIKILYATAYIQSLYFINCNARRWSGDLVASQGHAYDIQVIGGLFEAGAGNCFNLQNPVGCKFWTQIEGMTGTALLLPNCNGVDISGYFESNGLDFDCRTGATQNYGIKIHGSVFSNGTTTYTVRWGSCVGCSSQGNWHTGYMHDLLSTSIVDINDVAQNGLSNLDAIAHIGIRQGNTPSLSVRGASSDGYSVSQLTSKYTYIGKRVLIDFICTLTSTGTNPADMIYIPSLFPQDAAIGGLLCGSVEVVGSTTNSGISTLYIANASPLQVLSSVNVIPANTSGSSWTVRGQISYNMP